MTRILTITAIALALTSASACSPGKGGLEIQTGSEITLEKKDGGKVAGRLIEAKPEHVIVESRDGVRTSVPRADIAALRANTNVPQPDHQPAAGAVGSPAAAATPEGGEGTAKAGRADPDSRPKYREVTIPVGTILPVELRTRVSSDSSNVEDPVRATLRQPVTVGGVQVLPAGTAVLGHVTAAERSARVKGRAFVAFRFTAIDPPGDTERTSIRTDTVSRFAPATKKQDAMKIGGSAAGGAIIGGILGGGDGAAKGAAVGGGAGTGVVLATRGKEVRLGPGADVAVRLAAPVTVRLPAR